MSKYKSEKIIHNGIKFDSKIESRFYDVLLEQKKIGRIKYIELQPVFVILDSQKYKGKTLKSTTYKGDFLTVDKEGKKVVYDTKGFCTPMAKLKYKMFLSRFSKDYDLVFITESKKYGINEEFSGWIDYFKLEKLLKKEKKLKTN